jgi:hypothetical protein
MKSHLMISAALLFGFTIAGNAQGTDPKELIGLIKQNLATSMQNLKNYEWLETITVTKDGEVKSNKQSQCYYSVDNKLMKVPIGNAQEAKSPGGIRGKVAANKKASMKDYVEQCVAKIQEYLPPSGEKLQSLYATGKTTLAVLKPNELFKINFSDYLQAGDAMAVSIDQEKKLLTEINVNTYVDGPEDKIAFKITYAQLPDGTQYAKQTVLDMPAKKLKIVIANDGYKKGAGK